ncbi:hypothetical protein HanIR_Chr02g0059121 [Helianthus annuus]|nr:hypothetical protein HanIR_Chr02g0059121 [Helianthus annuus]
MILVIFLVMRIYEDIIDEEYNELILIWFTDLVHEIHEHYRYVRELERHPKELIMSISYSRGSLWNIFVLNSQLVTT